MSDIATLREGLLVRLAERGDAPAILWNDDVLSYRRIDEWSAALAAGIGRRSIGPGDRVAVGLPNSPELVACVLAVLRSGAALVPLNPAYTADEACYVARDSEPLLVITHPAQARALADGGCAAPIATDVAELQSEAGDAPPLVAPESPALIVYTSGTTGRPKGAVLSQAALHTNLTTVATAWQWTSEDRLLLTLPCFHLHGLALGILGSLLVGSSIVLRERFAAADVPRLLADRECTTFFGVPTMYNRLVALSDEALAGVDLGRMRLWVSGSAPLTAATFERFRSRFGHAILERFGMSEGGFMLSASYDGPRRAGVVGRPLPGVEMRIVDPDLADAGRIADVPRGEMGELLFRGPNLFSGYWRRPEETAAAFAAGYFRSGDLGVEEPDGMVRIAGRRSLDVIKSAGFKIGAVEIESCLQEHPAVAEVAVVGMPDSDRGEIVVAVVTTGAPVDADELMRFARARLAPHKIPARIVFRAEIPRTGPGKFDKRALIAELSAGDV